jgi:hypothetical protein
VRGSCPGKISCGVAEPGKTWVLLGKYDTSMPMPRPDHQMLFHPARCSSSSRATHENSTPNSHPAVHHPHPYTQQPPSSTPSNHPAVHLPYAQQPRSSAPSTSIHTTAPQQCTIHIHTHSSHLAEHHPHPYTQQPRSSHPAATQQCTIHTPSSHAAVHHPHPYTEQPPSRAPSTSIHTAATQHCTTPAALHTAEQ